MKYLIEIFKSLLSLITSIGVGAIVGNAIKSTTPTNVKRVTKICISVGSVILAGVASDAASKYTETKIDETVEAVNNAFNKKPEIAEAEIVEGEEE